MKKWWRNLHEAWKTYYFFWGIAILIRVTAIVLEARNHGKPTYLSTILDDIYLGVMASIITTACLFICVTLLKRP